MYIVYTSCCWLLFCDWFSGSGDDCACVSLLRLVLYAAYNGPELRSSLTATGWLINTVAFIFQSHSDHEQKLLKRKESWRRTAMTSVGIYQPNTLPSGKTSSWHFIRRLEHAMLVQKIMSCHCQVEKTTTYIELLSCHSPVWN